MKTYLQQLKDRVDHYESKDENATTNAERENFAWAKRTLAEYESFLRDSPAQDPVKLRSAIDDAVDYASGRETEWGSRAEHCFWILEQAKEGKAWEPDGI